MKKQALNYEQAMARLEEILSSLEQGQLSLDQVTSALRESQELIALCKAQLLKVETDINEILSPDGTR